jgi:hypothetical protein
MQQVASTAISSCLLCREVQLQLVLATQVTQGAEIHSRCRQDGIMGALICYWQLLLSV